MSEIITRDEALKTSFDARFFLDIRNRFEKPINLDELLYVACDAGLIEGEYQEVFDNYKQVFVNYAVMSLDVQPDVDIDLFIKNHVRNSFDNVNQFINESDSPYDALMAIISKDPYVAIDEINNRASERRAAIITRLKKLYEDGKYIAENHYLFGRLFSEINTNLRGEYTGFSYNPLCILDVVKSNFSIGYGTGSSPSTRALPFTVLEKVMDSIEREISIINKFNKEEVITLLKNLPDSEYYSCISDKVLNNYVLNSFYKDEPTILFTSNMADIIDRDMANGFIDIDEVKDAVENGPIKFSEEDLDFIREVFLHRFQECIDNKVSGDSLYTVTDYMLRKI